MAVGKISVSSEYRTPKVGNYKYKRVKHGNTVIGEVREYKAKPGQKAIRIYWAIRLQGESLRKGLAWSFSKALLPKLAELGIPLTHIGVLVTRDAKRSVRNKVKIEEMWLMRREDFMKARVEVEAEDRKHTHFAVPMNAFAVTRREVSDEIKIKEMAVGRERRAA